MTLSELLSIASNVPNALVDNHILIADSEGVELRAFEFRIINGNPVILAQHVPSGDMLTIDDWTEIAAMMPENNTIANVRELRGDEEINCAHGIESDPLYGSKPEETFNYDDDRDDSFTDRKENAEEDDEDEEDYFEYDIDDEDDADDEFEDDDGYDLESL
jgi:hypothetical protein